MQMIKRLFAVIRSDRLFLALTVCLGLLGGLLVIRQAALVSQVVNDVFLGHRLLSAEAGLFRALILIVMVRSLLAWANELSAGRLSVRVKNRLRQELFEALLKKGPAFARAEKVGEMTGTIFDGVEALGIYFSQYFPQLALAALVPLAILIVVFPRDFLSGLVLLLTAPLIPVFMYLIGKGAEALTRRQWDTLRRLEAYFLDSLQGLATLRLFNRSHERAQSIARTSDQFRKVTLQVLRVTFLSAFVLELVATISTAMVAVEVSLRLFYGHLAFQQAFFLLLLAPEFYLPLRLLGLRFHAGMSGLAAARRIFELTDPFDSTPQAASGPALNGAFFSSLHISSVCFTYPGETRPALENVEFEVRQGQHVALVGLTGAGKSTLAALIMGFLQPARGQISLNGFPYGGLSLEAWRGLIAWVPQTPHLFHDTIAANLRLARPGASLQDLEAALQAAGLAEFVHSLPQGLETVIGEEGARLSGGEAQRLALARAFLKDAPILLLDEPTSSLDPVGEESMVEAIRQLMQGRTVITIAHRRNTFMQADCVHVLEQGRLVESGSHSDLLARNGSYARLLRGDDLSTASVMPLQIKTAYDDGDLVSRFPDQLQIESSFVSSPASSTRIFLRLLSFLKGSWSWVSLSILLGVLTVGSNIGLMGTAAYLISAAALQPPFGALQVAIVGVRFFGISRGVFRYSERLTSHNVTFRLLSRLRVWFYQALEPLAPARLMQYRSGDLLARIIADVDTLENFYVRAVAPPIVALVVAAGMFFYLSQFGWNLAWVHLGLMVLLGAFIPLFSWMSSRKAGEQLILRRASLQSLLVDGLRGLAELLAFNRGPGYAASLASEERLYGQLQEKLASFSGWSNALTLLGSNLGVLAVLALTIPLATSGKIFGPMLAAVVLAVQASFEAVLPLAPAAQALSTCNRAAKRLFEVVDAAPPVSDPVHIQEIPLRCPSIEISDLHFNYPGSSRPALEGIDLTLKPGGRMAVVGPSGSGKSTLLHLLLRFWDFSQGKILLDGMDLHGFAQQEIRRQFSVHQQKPAFFDDTILQNLLLANPSASATQVQAAIRRACLDGFIAGLPKDLETVIGERGLRLSGGERQRLSLARAYLRNAPIYLLDEPCANLDPQTENAVLESLLNDLQGHSLLLITHRLACMDRMDEIIVLDHGRVVERGTHAGLLAHAGLYSRMWHLQNNMKFL